MTLPFSHVALVGLGLIGSSIARAARARTPGLRLTAHDSDPAVRDRAREIGLVDQVFDEAADAVRGAGLVILCVPVGAMAAAAGSIAPGLGADTIVSDVGSSKQDVSDTLRRVLPDARIVPAHPVAGTEHSGPDAGFATLFEGRWCILTPRGEKGRGDILPTHPRALGDVEAVADFWTSLGARIEIMDAEHHDLVLAVTSHLPHLIAYTIVGTASDLERVTESEVIKYSAGGFRDFTRIAASNPTMWRDIFLANKKAVLDMLQRFSEDLSHLQRAIRRDDGETLHELFTATREIRRSVIEQGQDVAAPDFGRASGR